MKKLLSIVVIAVISAASGYSGPAVNIVNRQSSLCLDISGGSNNPGAQIIQATCNECSTTQLFSLSYPNDVFANIVTNDGLCLTISGSPNDGTPIVQEPCNSTNIQQQFQVIQLANSYFAFRAHAPHGFCLSIQHGSTQPNAPLILWRCLDFDDNKQFSMTAPGN